MAAINEYIAGIPSAQGAPRCGASGDGGRTATERDAGGHAVSQAGGRLRRGLADAAD
jgi:hypothetical protein